MKTLTIGQEYTLNELSTINGSYNAGNLYTPVNYGNELYTEGLTYPCNGRGIVDNWDYDGQCTSICNTGHTPFKLLRLADVPTKEVKLDKVTTPVKVTTLAEVHTPKTIEDARITLKGDLSNTPLFSGDEEFVFYDSDCGIFGTSYQGHPDYAEDEGIYNVCTVEEFNNYEKDCDSLPLLKIPDCLLEEAAKDPSSPCGLLLAAMASGAGSLHEEAIAGIANVPDKLVKPTHTKSPVIGDSLYKNGIKVTVIFIKKTREGKNNYAYVTAETESTIIKWSTFFDKDAPSTKTPYELAHEDLMSCLDLTDDVGDVEYATDLLGDIINGCVRGVSFNG